MIKRGELYYADLSPVVGSEQGGIRPILIVQNDTGNKYSPTIIAAAVTSKLSKAKLPTHIEIGANEFGLVKGRSARTNPDARQAQAERTYRRTIPARNEKSQSRVAYKPGI